MDDMDWCNDAALAAACPLAARMREDETRAQGIGAKLRIWAGAMIACTRCRRTGVIPPAAWEVAQNDN